MMKLQAFYDNTKEGVWNTFISCIKGEAECSLNVYDLNQLYISPAHHKCFQNAVVGAGMGKCSFWPLLWSRGKENILPATTLAPLLWQTFTTSLQWGKGNVGPYPPPILFPAGPQPAKGTRKGCTSLGYTAGYAMFLVLMIPFKYKIKSIYYHSKCNFDSCFS